MTDDQITATLSRLESYYDLVPRSKTKVEEFDEFTLFVSTGAWPYYARPRLGFTGPFTLAAVGAVRERQRELRVPESFEWVHEVHPDLVDAATRAGLVVEQRPLLVHDLPVDVAPPTGISIRFVAADDPDLARAVAAVDIGFGTPGSEIGSAGPTERDEHADSMPKDRLAHFRDQIAGGLLRWAVAEDASGPVGGGSYHPRGDVTELTGISTLPSARRGGIGTAVTAALTADAIANGVTLAFLSAGSLGAARVYEQAGFRLAGTACVAAPPASDAEGTPPA